jgi:hypothetical protein
VCSTIERKAALTQAEETASPQSRNFVAGPVRDIGKRARVQAANSRRRSMCHADDRRHGLGKA